MQVEVEVGPVKKQEVKQKVEVGRVKRQSGMLLLCGQPDIFLFFSSIVQ